jgi:hypothetical protein
MPGPDYRIRVERLDGELVVIDGLAIARAFFLGDPSSVGDESFDSLAGRGESDRIEVADIQAINRSMRTRSEHARWDPVINGDFAWLRRIPSDLDLLETDDEDWAAAGGDRLLRGGFEATIGPYRGLARAGKVLHLKRPKLFPVLDRLVAEMLGVPIPNQPEPEDLVRVARLLTAVIRREGRANLDTLRAIRDTLAAEGTQRELARVFDVIMWFSHPAASVPNAHRVIVVRLRD